MSTPILTMDFETDPFTTGHFPECRCGCRLVKPFACGLYDGRDFVSHWSRDCAARMVKSLEKRDPSIIYMHNGGRFDLFFLMPWLHSDMCIINGRIVKARLGDHEIRDSYAILPMSLGAMGGKLDIDIQKLNAECRSQHRVEILEYLKQDCVGLHALVTQFRDEFGDYLTIGSAAMAQIKRFHPFIQGNSVMDERFRSQFFFGGRVQCFAAGEIKKPFRIHDINSAYPFVMKTVRHPNSDSYTMENRVTKNTAFVIAEGTNVGAFPIRNKKGGIEFTQRQGTFCSTIHEWNAAEETRTFRPAKVVKTYNFERWIVFDEFVDHFYGARLKAKLAKDRIHEIFYKLILNSSYGKFAQNPENFYDFKITQFSQRLESPWQEHFIDAAKQFIIWRKPVTRHSYYNVSIGASITGATRAMLLRGISHATDLLYCDTDSIIAGSLTGVPLSNTELGAWKVEGSGDRMVIAGKKMYACFDGKTEIKRATKGAKISSADIESVAAGEVVHFHKLAPTFKLDGRVEFISRNIRRTV